MTDDVYTTIEAYRREQREWRDTLAGLAAISVFGAVVMFACAWVM